MKFSESWLRTFVNPTLSGEEFSHLLTMAGLEVEEEETVAPPFNDVVVAQVLEVNKHPDADRLNVCRVDIGDGSPKQIVCGRPASRCRARWSVPVAGRLHDQDGQGARHRILGHAVLGQGARYRRRRLRAARAAGGCAGGAEHP
jgi:hypothetical protein